MNPLFLTLTFLTMMSVLTSSELAKLHRSSLETRLYDNYLAHQRAKEKNHAEALIEAFKEEEKNGVEEIIAESQLKPSPIVPKDSPKKGSSKARLNIDFARPPNNSRLNLYLVLHGDPQQKLYEIGARLIRDLYKEAPFFQACDRLEYQILDALLEQKDGTTQFYYPDELASLKLSSQHVQHALYLMFKGFDCPSLLNYITYDEKMKRDDKKINLMFASEELIRAIFDGSPAASQLLSLRADLFAQMDADETLNRTEIKRLLKTGVENIIVDYGLDQQKYDGLFDFSLGKKGNILLVRDKSGLVIRDKFTPNKA